MKTTIPRISSDNCKRPNALVRVWQFYRDGFRSMTWGRVVWLILLVKLFIIFFVLKLFFFPRYLSTERVGEDKGAYVSSELERRAVLPSSTDIVEP